MYPDDIKYHKEHTWIRKENGKVGISFHAQEALGDIVFLDLSAEGTDLSMGDKFGEVESVKSVSALYAPVSGKITAINQDAIDRPEIINQEPYGDGWLIEMELADPGETESLLSAADYQKMIEESS